MLTKYNHFFLSMLILGQKYIYFCTWKLDNPYYHNQKILKRSSPRKWCWHWKGWYLQITIFQIYLTLRTSSRKWAHCKYFLLTMFNANNVSVLWHLARHFSVSSNFKFSIDKVSAQEPSFCFTWFGPSKVETMWKFFCGVWHFWKLDHLLF